MSAFEGLNRIGRCTLCEKQIYDIKTVYPVGHPYAGEGRSIGKAMPDARVVTMILMDGAQCKITMCCGCLEESFSWAWVWRKLLRTWQLEGTDRYRALNNSPALSQEQKVSQSAWLQKMVFNVPVGTLIICEVGERDG